MTPEITEKAGQDKILTLIERLQTEDKDEREQAIRALIQYGEAAFEPLVAALKHDSISIRTYAALALGRLGDKRAIDALNEMLDAEDEDSEACLTATVALGQLGDDKTIEYCISGLEDSDSEERVGSVIALGLIRDKRAVGPLLLALKDPVNSVRCFAAAALGEIGDVQALPALEDLERNSTRLTAEGRRAKTTATEAIKTIKEGKR